MSLKRMNRGLLKDLPSNIVNGTFYIAKDAEKIFLDIDDERIEFDGSNDITHFGFCQTAAGVAQKIVSCPNFKLIEGAVVIIHFSATNTASNPTLNVNSTGAKAIVYKNSAIPANALMADKNYIFIYDGVDYQFVGDIKTGTKSVASSTPPSSLDIGDIWFVIENNT